MAIPDVKQALRAWLMAATGLPGDRVIFANQNGPRPATPFATLNPRLSLARVGAYDEERATDDPDTTERCGLRRLTVSINLYGTDALTRIEDALDGLEMQANWDALKVAGLSFIEHTEARDLTAMLETQFETRAQADVYFYVASSRLDEVSHIATVEGVGDVNGVSEPYSITE